MQISFFSLHFLGRYLFFTFCNFFGNFAGGNKYHFGVFEGEELLFCNKFSWNLMLKYGKNLPMWGIVRIFGSEFTDRIVSVQMYRK